jgi:hypothetical protein
MRRSHLARTFALLGEIKKAADWLAWARDAPAHFRRRMIAWMALDQDIALMRGHARFEHLMMRFAPGPTSAIPPTGSKRAAAAGS